MLTCNHAPLKKYKFRVDYKMEKIEQKVLNFIDWKNLLEKGDRVLVALSGGPDSVCLLHLLNKFKRRLGIEIGVVHINHMIRGKDAFLDEEFCRNLSLNLNIGFYAVRKRVRTFALKNKTSLEEAGRIVRYKEFRRISLKQGFNKIATAHNSGDNAETVLLNLIKGTGLKGISGIPSKRENIIRPVLNLSKEEILDYLDKKSLPYRIDATNFSNDYERNFLRNEIIPLIKQRLNPDVESTFFNSSEVFENAAGIIDELLTGLSNGGVSYSENELKISIDKLKGINKKLTGFFLKSVIEKKLSSQIGFGDIKKIISLTGKEAGKKEELSGSHFVLRERNELIISKAVEENKFAQVYLDEDESVNANDKILSIKNCKEVPKKFPGSPSGMHGIKMKEYISAEKIKGRFLLREWKNGDRFIPLGLKGSKKISDFLNEQKIPSSSKRNQLVLVNNNKIVWVVGLRLDERFKITNQTKKAYELWLR